MDIFGYNPETGDIHHAYFVVGDVTESLPAVHELLASLGVVLTGNPDLWHGKFDTFAIDDARTLSTSDERHDFGGKRKIFIIETNFISFEAQNALLKVFEEPTAGTHFFILSPQDTLLPTLRSRVQMVATQSQQTKAALVNEISGLDVGERMKLVKDLVDEISDEEQTKQGAINLVNKLQIELYEKGVVKNHRDLALCEGARTSLLQRGAPIKMILEHLMLSIR